MLSGTTSSRTVTRCACSLWTSDFCQFCSAGFLPPPIPDFSLLPVVFLRRAQWILSVALRDFSDDLQLKLQEERVLMSLRNGVDMSAVLVLTSSSSTFYLLSSSFFGSASVRNIGDNRTYFFFYRGIFIISREDHVVPGDLFILLPTPLFP